LGIGHGAIINSSSPSPTQWEAKATSAQSFSSILNFEF